MVARIGVPQKISDLPELTSSLQGTELLPVVTGTAPQDVTRQATVNDIRGLSLGATADRPTDLPADASFVFFDSDLGKPVFWTGSAWVDATGASA
jgi:hypothetical protein